MEGLNFVGGQPGIVTGFLGPNGSGKSTTMRMIAGLDRPTARRVDEVIDIVGLRDVAGKRVGGFSLAIGQRLDVASS